MWTVFYQWASPQRFYVRTGVWIPWIFSLAGLILLLGIVWGLIFAPPDYQQGDAFRIIYVHVPCAFLSMALFASMAFFAVLLLVWRIKLAGLLIAVVAQTGACLTLLALLTGSLWGKPMWGAFWVWDARLTSELILLLLYSAILVTAQTYQHHARGDFVVAILVLVGVVDLPIIHYSVYWWNTLHQVATLLAFAKPKIDPQMAYPLVLTLLGFLGVSVGVILLKARQVLLLRERRQQWVQAMMRLTNR